MISVSKELDRLSSELRAIRRVLDAALQEPDPESQRRWLTAADTATRAAERQRDTAKTEEARRRAALRIVRGGAAAVAAFLLAGRMRTRSLWEAHQAAAATAAVGAVGAGAAVALWIAPWSGPPGGGRVEDGMARLRPSASAPAVTPTRTAPPPSASASPSGTSSAGATTSAPTPGGGPSPMDDIAALPVPTLTVAPSLPVTAPPVPPAGSITIPPAVSPPPTLTRCALRLPVPVLDVQVGRLLCL